MVVGADQWRPALIRILWEVRHERASLVTTNWTLYEALSIARRSANENAAELLRQARRSSDIVSIDEVTERRALANFLSWDDKKASIVDHANVLVASQRRCDSIMTFDRDFSPLAAAAGLRILR